jgi:hypothetical protein
MKEGEFFSDKVLAEEKWKLNEEFQQKLEDIYKRSCILDLTW